MSTTVTINVLSDNSTTARGLIAEQGLSLWIEAGGRRILFDTGQGMALAHNPKLMGVDLATATDVVLSHGHYDHAGGLNTVLARIPRIHLYMHPEAFRERYSRRDGKVSSIGMSAPPDLETRVILHPAGSSCRISPDILLTGEIPRRNSFEDVGGAFYRDRDCTCTDQIPDDQALAIDTTRGTVVVVGCAHSGLINTLDYIWYLTRERSIYAVIGGMHLLNASEERLARTIDALRRYNVQLIAPMHCTGWRATATLINASADRVLELRAGMRYDLA